MKYLSDHKEFADVVLAVANERNLPPSIIEKDYFLTRALALINGQLRGQFIFKGGTSLSKGWSVIDRFSEDIDLLFKSEGPDGKSLSGGTKDRLMKQPEEILKANGFTRSEKGFSSDRGVHRTVAFTYAVSTKWEALISNRIVLEMGTRGGIHPTSLKTIGSMVAEFLVRKNEILADDITLFEMDLLDVTRTFIEKLYAVHAAFHANKALNKARHYYDLGCLASMEEITKFVASPDCTALCRDVENFSRQHFPNAAIPENGFKNSRAFALEGDDLRAVKHYYEQEQKQLAFGETITLEECLARISPLLAKMEFRG
jgi:predicted nucleotidyltransferase component of viral defense system